jgi:hypothetical protein
MACYKGSFISFALECAAMTAQDNQDGLKLNVTHQLLDSTEAVNLHGENTHIMQTKIGTLLTTNTDIGLEVFNSMEQSPS